MGKEYKYKEMTIYGKCFQIMMWRENRNTIKWEAHTLRSIDKVTGKKKFNSWFPFERGEIPVSMSVNMMLEYINHAVKKRIDEVENRIHFEEDWANL